jgi:hypothetical protein
MVFPANNPQGIFSNKIYTSKHRVLANSGNYNPGLIIILGVSGGPDKVIKAISGFLIGYNKTGNSANLFLLSPGWELFL